MPPFLVFLSFFVSFLVSCPPVTARIRERRREVAEPVTEPVAEVKPEPAAVVIPMPEPVKPEFRQDVTRRRGAGRQMSLS